MRADCLSTIAAVSIVSVVAPRRAQDSAETRAHRAPDSVSVKDITKPTGKTRTIDFVATESSNMSVSATPDGQWVVFDLLSNIYRVRITGGDAECLTESGGAALNFQPSVSPDGTTIAFISDRSGQNNLWLMDIDGKHPRQLYASLTQTAVEPIWTPDGSFVMVRQGGAILEYPREGGKPIEVRRGGVFVSPSSDGKYLYYQMTMPLELGYQAISGTDVLSGRHTIRRLTLATGDTMDVISGVDNQNNQRFSSGGAIAPQVSPDGRWLAFARRIPTGTLVFKGHEFTPRNALWLRDLTTGREHVVIDPIEIDAAEGVKTLRVLPGYTWTADGKFILISSGGKIRKFEMSTRKVTTVPFRARVHRVISEQAVGGSTISDASFESKFTLWHTASPDGKKLVFQAVGRLWFQDLPRGTPRRLTPATFRPLEYAPAWSPDGRWIAFTTLDSLGRGMVWKVDAGGGAPIALATDAGEYANPSWRSDGQELVVSRGEGVSFQGRPESYDAWREIVRIPAAGGGGGATSIVRVDQTIGAGEQVLLRPTYNADGRIYFVDRSKIPLPPPAAGGGRGGRGGGGAGAGSENANDVLVSVLPDGSDRREHARFAGAVDIVPSPDGKWATYQSENEIYVAPIPGFEPGRRPPVVDDKAAGTTARKVSALAGFYPRWRDATTIEYGNLNVYSTYRVDSRSRTDVALHLTVPRAASSGRIALTNARIVTMKGREVIPRGTIVIDGPRISCVGTCATTGAARVIDMSGKTIIPGFVDMHAHRTYHSSPQIPPRGFEVSASLAEGVTTDLDPSAASRSMFQIAEMTEAGELIGPRSFTTAETVGPRLRNTIESYADAARAVSQRKAWGAVSIKQYRLTRRDQRQWLVEASRDSGLVVTSEGDDYDYNIGTIIDGQKGWEHNLSATPAYSDITTFMGNAHAVYSATLVGTGFTAWNEEYFFQASDVWKDKKVQMWNPANELFPHLRRRVLRPVTDYTFPLYAQSIADIIAAGGYGAIGSHARQYAIAAHWEIEMLSSALGPHGAIEVATMHGAHFIGMEHDIGSLEVGKLADLIVLNANPLESIKNVYDMKYVMKGGVLYDSDSLDEVWPKQQRYGPHYWMSADILRGDKRPTTYFDRPR